MLQFSLASSCPLTVDKKLWIPSEWVHKEKGQNPPIINSWLFPFLTFLILFWFFLLDFSSLIWTVTNFFNFLICPVYISFVLRLPAYFTDIKHARTAWESTRRIIRFSLHLVNLFQQQRRYSRSCSRPGPGAWRYSFTISICFLLKQIPFIISHIYNMRQLLIWQQQLKPALRKFCCHFAVIA